MEGPAKTKQLPTDVAKNFETAAGHGVGEYHWNGNVVHLDRISATRAAELVTAGFPYLVAKEAGTAAEKAPKAPKAPADTNA